jgi:hypothetical protein
LTYEARFEVIEKKILPIFNPCTFSHRLDQKEKFLARLMTSAAESEAAGQSGSGDPSKLGQQLPLSPLFLRRWEFFLASSDFNLRCGAGEAKMGICARLPARYRRQA